MKSVSVILNCFRRPHSLNLQYEAVKKQSIPPKEILIWKNHPRDNTQFDFSKTEDALISYNNYNYGVWARFAFALNTTSDYICILDDDTIPGENWFANCIDKIENHANGLYGTIGVIFDDLDYSSYQRHGWANPNPKTDKISTIHSEVIELENPVIHESIKKYVCIRPEIQNYIVEKFDIEKNQTEVIYNPIDSKRFNTNNTKDENYILFVGTIDYLRENTIKDLVTYSKEVGKELWLVGENKSNYLDELLTNEHVKYFNATSRVEAFVKNCSETAGILLGRTTIEGWMCGKPGWIYNVESSGYIVDKKLHEPPSNIIKFDSIEVAKKIKEEYIKILN